jgi:hypothetical protein
MARVLALRVVPLGGLTVVWLIGAGVLGLGVIVSQGVGDAPLGDVLLVVDALGVDAEQHFDAVPGPLGYLSWRYAAVESQR